MPQAIKETHKLEAAEALRIVIYLAMILIFGWLDDAITMHWVSVWGLGIALLSQAAQRPTFFRLSMVWQVGYLVIVAREGIYDGSAIAAIVGSESVTTASRYVSMANAAMLLAYTSVFREASLRHVRPLHEERFGRSYAAGLFIGGLYFLFLYAGVPQALRLSSVGRLGIEGSGDLVSASVLDTLSAGLQVSIGMCLPSIIGYYVVRVRKYHFLVALLLVMPIFVVQLLLGTRFFLLFSVSGFAFLFLAARRFSGRAVLRLAAVGALLIVAGAVMVRFRSRGIQDFSTEQVLQTTQNGEPLMHYEGVVLYLARLTQYFEYRDPLYGASTGMMLLFWVPRALWPDKPTLLGYWLPRSIGLTGVSKGHSSALTFAADPYADFGFWGGVAFCFLLGLGFAKVEAWCARSLSQTHNPSAVIATTLYGASFFAVRSLDTTLIALSGIVVCALIFRKLVDRDRRLERRPPTSTLPAAA